MNVCPSTLLWKYLCVSECFASCLSAVLSLVRRRQYCVSSVVVSIVSRGPSSGSIVSSRPSSSVLSLVRRRQYCVSRPSSGSIVSSRPSSSVLSLVVGSIVSRGPSSSVLSLVVRRRQYCVLTMFRRRNSRLNILSSRHKNGHSNFRTILHQRH